MLRGPDLDELAESLLSDEVVAVFPLAWISAQWLELGTADGTTRTVQVSDEAVARDERRVEPPLRRCAAARALRSGIARVRRAALDRRCELDGPGAALRHARSDTDRTVRAWRPPGTPTPAQAELPGIAPSLP